MKRDKSFDYIRVLAMLAIVLCHFFQVLGYTGVALWLNTGVQVFFVLSARLVCTKKFENKSDVLSFYKSRVLRIYIPVWIYLACLVPALIFIGRAPEPVALVMYVAGMAGFSKTGVLGIGHFWYITVLLLCYIIVPLLYKVAVKAQLFSKTKAFLLKAICPVASVLLFAFTDYKFYGINIALFCISYFCFFPVKDNVQLCKKGAKLLFAPAIAMVIVKAVLDMTELKDNVFYDGLAATSIKAVLGVFLFFALYLLFSQRKKEDASKITLFISDLSYEIYIVHQFILLALVEFIPFFSSSAAGASALLVCSGVMILVNAIIVYYIKKFVEKRFLKK